jgi:predicted permease
MTSLRFLRMTRINLMESLISLFAQNILPILLTAGAGYVLGKTLEIEPKTLSRVVFYFFSPCLIFTLLTENKLNSSDTYHIIVFAITSALLVGLVTFLVGKWMKLKRDILAAMLITTMFTNAGNFGLSLNSFAFGNEALAYASIFFVMSGLMINTIGVLIASSGKTSVLKALFGLLRFPAVYAIIVSVIFNTLDWSMPTPILRAINILGDGAIPGMLVLLGLQLQRISLNEHKTPLGWAVALRMLVAPAIALGLSVLFNLAGPAKQAAVTEASMPTAVMTVIATEFDIHPSFVTTVVTATTLLSPLTLTPLLAILGGH